MTKRRGKPIPPTPAANHSNILGSPFSDQAGRNITTADNNDKQPSPSPRVIICYIFLMVAHFVAVLFTGFIIYTASPGSSLFSWHPTLMAISFCFLMFEAILIFSPHSSLISLKSRSTKVTWHWVTLLVAFISAVGGIIIIYYNKALNNKSHFTSWHGLIGIITMVYFMLQLCGGLFVRYPKLIPSIRLIDLRLYHATSGLVAFLLVCFTLFLSMYSNWFCKNITGTSWYACVGCIGLMTTMITNQVTSAYIPRLQKRLQQKISAPI